MLFNPLKIGTLITRPWRLCPALNDFEDRQCLAFISAAWRTRQFSLFLGMVVAGIGGGGSLLAFAVTLERILPRNSVWLDTGEWQDRLLLLAFAAIWMPTIVAVAFTPYMWMLRHAVRRLLVRAVCARCGYSLQGLPVLDGAVVCPECGMTTNLRAAGLTPESIALGRPVPHHSVRPIPAQQDAPYAIASGLPPGWWTSLVVGAREIGRWLLVLAGRHNKP